MKPLLGMEARLSDRDAGFDQLWEEFQKVKRFFEDVEDSDGCVPVEAEAMLATIEDILGEINREPTRH